MKKILLFLKTKIGAKAQKPIITVQSIERKQLEKKVVEGAQKALKEYGRVFERLAEYDRT